MIPITVQYFQFVPYEKRRAIMRIINECAECGYLNINRAIRANAHSSMEAATLKYWVDCWLKKYVEGEDLPHEHWFVVLHLQKQGFIDVNMNVQKKLWEFGCMPAGDKEQAQKQIENFSRNDLYLVNGEYETRKDALQIAGKYEMKHWNYLDKIKEHENAKNR